MTQVNNENGTTNVVIDETTSVNVSTVEETKVEETKVDEKEESKPKEEVKKSSMSLTHLDEEFVYELMSIPTYSDHEYRLVTFIVLWARRNGIDYEFDDYGNVYLTKGEVGEGEFYPCVTAHLDSVQSKHKLYIQAGQNLDVKTRIVKNKHEIYVEGMGIGGDDKAGVLIGLSMFKHVDKLKACFFLEEETGCRGSKNLNKTWFNNVGYVLGYDSPDLNRAAYACSGTKLFSAKFFKEHMRDICKKHGLTDFRSEPFTDVKEIREQTNIMCMNFGSGYYNCHSSNEYCVIEDMDTACRMGHELIEHLGLERHELEHKAYSAAWVKQADGSYKKPEEDEDEAFLKTLSSYYVPVTKSTTSTTTTKSNVTTTSYPSSSSSTTKTNSEPSKDLVEMETLQYVAERYEERIDTIKEDIQKICKDNNIDFALFASAFSTEIKF